MESRDADIGKSVLRLRTGAGISQQDVAQAMRDRGWKWNQTTSWSIEANRRPLRLAEAVDLADVLGVRLDDLLHDPISAVLGESEKRLGVLRSEQDRARWDADELDARVRALRKLQVAAGGEDIQFGEYGPLSAIEAFGNLPWEQTASILTYIGVPMPEVDHLGELYDTWTKHPLDHTDPFSSPVKPLDSPDFELWDAMWQAIRRALPSIHAPEVALPDE